MWNLQNPKGLTESESHPLRHTPDPFVSITYRRGEGSQRATPSSFAWSFASLVLQNRPVLTNSFESMATWVLGEPIVATVGEHGYGPFAAAWQGAPAALGISAATALWQSLATDSPRGRDELRLVSSPICRFFIRRNCHIWPGVDTRLSTKAQFMQECAEVFEP